MRRLDSVRRSELARRVLDIRKACLSGPRALFTSRGIGRGGEEWRADVREWTCRRVWCTEDAAETPLKSGALVCSATSLRHLNGTILRQRGEWHCIEKTVPTTNLTELTLSGTRGRYTSLQRLGVFRCDETCIEVLQQVMAARRACTYTSLGDGLTYFRTRLPCPERRKGILISASPYIDHSESHGPHQPDVDQTRCAGYLTVNRHIGSTYRYHRVAIFVLVFLV